MREKKFESFKDQLRKILILYLLIPIIFFAMSGYGIMYLLEYRAIKNQNIENTKILAKNLDDTIRQYFNEIEKISNDKDIINSVINKKPSNLSYEKIYNSITPMKVEGNFIIYDKDLHIIMANTKFIGSEDNYNWGLFNKMIKSPNEIIFKISRLHFQNQESSVFSIGKAIKNGEKIIGFTVYNILDNSLKELIGDSGSFNVVVTDRYHNIAITTNESFKDEFGKTEKTLKKSLGYSVINNKKYFVNKKEIYYSNIILYTISEAGYIVDNFLDGMLYMSIFFLIILISMYHAAKIIANKKTETIEEIVKAIEHIKTGDLDTRLHVKSNDEFGIIADSYNDMLLNIKKLIEKSKEETKHSVVSEIKQLESQFNPHFLFNTLEMLRYTIKLDTSMASKIILNLSSILRFSIENKSSEVPLKVDTVYTKNYLEIQKYRLGENFEYKIKSEENLDKFLIPKLIIQPIIENAIKHGYTQIKKMTIFIKIKKQKNNLLITVYNNGKGMEKNVLKEVRDRLNKKGKDLKNYIGIYNIFRRIQLMYGKEYGIRILSNVQKGTSVRLILPLKIGDDEL